MKGRVSPFIQNTLHCVFHFLCSRRFVPDSEINDGYKKLSVTNSIF